MRNMQHCYGVLVAAASALLLWTAPPAWNVAAEVPADTKAETAGERAHFAQAFCEVSAKRVGLFNFEFSVGASSAGMRRHDRPD